MSIVKPDTLGAQKMKVLQGPCHPSALRLPHSICVQPTLQNHGAHHVIADIFRGCMRRQRNERSCATVIFIVLVEMTQNTSTQKKEKLSHSPNEP